MKTMFKRNLLATLVLAFASIFTNNAHALTVTIGKVVEVFADPSDIVIVLDTPGTCGAGSNFFHIQRTNANFKELTAMALTAISAKKSMRLFIASCAGDRSILSHGSVF